MKAKRLYRVYSQTHSFIFSVIFLCHHKYTSSVYLSCYVVRKSLIFNCLHQQRNIKQFCQMKIFIYYIPKIFGKIEISHNGPGGNK